MKEALSAVLGKGKVDEDLQSVAEKTKRKHNREVAPTGFVGPEAPPEEWDEADDAEASSDGGAPSQ